MGAWKQVESNKGCGGIDYETIETFKAQEDKKLMKVLTKYVADGTVLDMIWAWLKSGYIEEEKLMESNSGTQQGGVISPLLSNIYLNELGWELE